MGPCNTKIKKRGNSTIVFTDDDDEARFNDGKPIFLQNGLRVTKNPDTNKLQGIPQQWATNFNLPFHVDYNRVVKTANFRKQIKPDEQYPDSIVQLLNNSDKTSRISSFISKKSLKQSGDIVVDKEKPYGLKNVPDYLVSTLSTSFHNPKEVSDPRTLADIISHIDEQLKQSKFQKQFVSGQELEARIKRVKFVQDNPIKNFIFTKQLGNGGVCKVFKAEARFAPGTFYAVRIMKQKDRQTLNRIRRQIAVMQYCNSPNIVEYNFTYYYRDSLFMFIEYMDGGSLTNFIKFHKKNVSENVIALAIREILKGLLAIHLKKQIHRDIKSDNILLDRRGRVKIADFGYALQLTADKLKTNGLAGTTAWMAPELVKKQEYDEKVDIWSLGILMIQFCQGEPPYLHMQPLRAMYKIASEQPPKISGYSLAMTNFVDSCLRKDPKERASAKQLLSHPFLDIYRQKHEDVDKFIAMISKCSI